MFCLIMMKAMENAYLATPILDSGSNSHPKVHVLVS